MKKFILIIILYFNILPVWNDGNIKIFQNGFIHAQGTYLIPPGSVFGNASNLLTYCRSLPGSNDFQFNIEGNGVRAYNLNTNTSTLIVLTQGSTAPTASSVAASLGLPIPTTSTSTTNSGGENGDAGDQEDNWLEFTLIINQLSSNPQADAIDEYYAILNGGGPSYEPTNNNNTCDPAISLAVMNTTIYSEALLPDNSTTVNIIVPPLPCANKFLLFGKIISFPTNKVPSNSIYNFDGSAINSVQVPNGDVYKSGVKYDVITDITEIISSSPECGTGASNTAITFSNERKTYKFICFTKIAQVSGVTTIQGYKASDGTSVTGYADIPENSTYSFTIPTSSIVTAHVGDQVVAKTKGGLTYCITLTQEDLSRGLTAERDKKYLPPAIESKLEHTINVPGWVREFFEIFNIPLSPCTQQRVNDGLDSLHAKPEYINEPSEGLKAVMEYKSMAYDMLFGGLYCSVDSNAAIGKSCAEQVAMGIMHEAISSVDVVQMRDGIVNMAKGLGNLVQQNVKDLIGGVESIVKETTTSGIYNMESVAKKIIKKNVTDLENVYNKAAAFAEQFKQMYFTNCGQICCYRKGELAMMIVPILLTAGDYAVVKLTNLAAKYGSRAGKAVRMLDEATTSGATIVDNIPGEMKIIEPADVGVDELTTVIKKENNGTDVKFERDNNVFEPYPTVSNPVLISGQKPKNYEFAGQTYHTSSGYDIPFDQYGFPDMDAVSMRTVRINGMQGNTTITNGDFSKANFEAFGVADPNYHLTVNNGQYANYTWHHHQDTKSMMLVPKVVNNPNMGGVSHTGGAAIVRHVNNGGAPFNFMSPPLK